MRMGFMFSEAFWGIFLILLGIAVVLKAFWGINIPLVRTAFAILLICTGISMLAGGNRWFYKHDNHTVMFGDSAFKAWKHHDREYEIIFGSGVIDLRQMKPGADQKKIEISTVFGSGTVLLDPNLPVEFKVDSVFAGASFPDGSNINFGEHTYRTPNFKPGEPYLEVEAEVVFGSLSICNQPVTHSAVSEAVEATE